MACVYDSPARNCLPLIAQCTEKDVSHLPGIVPSEVCWGSYLGALLGDDRHGRAADVAGAHAADLHVPVVAHGCFEE